MIIDYGVEDNDLWEHKDFAHSDCITNSTNKLLENFQKSLLLFKAI